MSKETAVAKVDHEFAILRMDEGVTIEDIMAENLGGGITLSDLDVAKVPAGGGLAWKVLDEDGKPTAVPELVGIIVAQQTLRSYYKENYTGTGTPPECSSEDGVKGVGNPGGFCRDCPKNAWGTGTDQAGRPTKGKACKERVRLYLLTKDSVLPTVVNVPPTSLRAFRMFCARLTKSMRSITGVVVRLGLTEAKSAAGIAFSQITFDRVADLTAEDRGKVRAYSKALQSLLSTAAYTPHSGGGAGNVGGTMDDESPFPEFPDDVLSEDDDI